ncbi:MAG TPA: hypothetical protein VF028_04850 [Actinomycetota bacterium]|nr:hypothetical protein [Actinomycetota bacterium]
MRSARRPHRPSCSSPRHPVWSPDGSKIAYQGAPGIWVLDLASGEDTMLDPELWGPVWLDDDTLIVAMPPPE